MVLRFIFLFVYILNTLSLGGGLTFELEHLFLFLSLSELRGDLLNGAFSTPVSSIYFAFLATRFDPFDPSVLKRKRSIKWQKKKRKLKKQKKQEEERKSVRETKSFFARRREIETLYRKSQANLLLY